MKPINRFTPKHVLTTIVGCLTFLCLVSWSPPGTEDVEVNSGDVIIRNGILEVRAGSNANINNIFSSTPAPALIVGNMNNIFRGTGDSELGRGLVVGATNTLSTAGLYSGVIGNANNVWASQSLVVGSSNNVSIQATDISTSTRASVISGIQNTINTDCESLLVGGKANTVKADATLVSGHSNTVGGPGTLPNATASSTSHSAAIGQLNLIASAFGWTMGYGNSVTGNRGVAIGSGLTASNTQSTALGRFNSPMQNNDVLVVGTGSSTSTANTALRVTNNGAVILGRAQGDISMGIYGN